MNYPHISATFCDEIQLAAGNKMTFVGVYSGAIIVPAFPSTIAKFSVHVSVKACPSSPPEKIRFSLELCGKSVADSEISMEVAADYDGDRERATLLDLGNRFPYLEQAVGIEFGSLSLERPGFLNVKVTIDGEEHYAPGLRIASIEEFQHHLPNEATGPEELRGTTN